MLPRLGFMENLLSIILRIPLIRTQLGDPARAKITVNHFVLYHVQA